MGEQAAVSVQATALCSQARGAHRRVDCCWDVGVSMCMCVSECVALLWKHCHLSPSKKQNEEKTYLLTIFKKSTVPVLHACTNSPLCLSDLVFLCYAY